MTEEIRCGIYRHYKGPLYQVLGLAHDANDETRTCVVYIGLQLDGAHLGPRLAVRTLEDFTGMVDLLDQDWETTPSFTNLPRFTYLGPTLTKEMISNA